MITMKQYMENVNYRITEGDVYYCRSFGTDLYCLSAWNGDQKGWSTNIVFDTKTQFVYMVEVCDYKNNRAYRLIHPDYVNTYKKNNPPEYDQTWDDINYIDLEVDEDWLQKASAIVAGVDYDTNISVPLDLDRDTMYDLMLRAHEQNITLNQLISDILTEAIETQLQGDQ